MDNVEFDWEKYKWYIHQITMLYQPAAGGKMVTGPEAEMAFALMGHLVAFLKIEGISLEDAQAWLEEVYESKDEPSPAFEVIDGGKDDGQDPDRDPDE
jgi:hypothetical protein